MMPHVSRDFAFAYLAGGRLNFVDASGEKHALESRFVESYKERARSIKRKTAWKTEGTGARFMGGGAGGSLLWGRDFDLDAVPVSFTGLARGQAPGQIVYSLSTGIVGGVFVYDTKTKDETRVFHSAEHRIEHLATSPDHGVIACALRNKDGTTSLAVMPKDGSQIQVVTEGDSIDLAPSWLPAAATKDGARHQLVFQSAGVGRDREGHFVAVGPAHVAILDPEHGELQPVVEDDTKDHLLPKMDAERTLFYVRRDYTPPAQAGVSPFRVVLDTLLFPFRIVFALLSYLNFFTVRYTGKPLMTSGNARQRSADMRNMLMMGNLANAEQIAARAAEKEDTAPLFAGWSLCARGENGDERVVARGVRAFDLLPDGAVLITDGSKIERIDRTGKRELVGKDTDVTDVVFVA